MKTAHKVIGLVLGIILFGFGSSDVSAAQLQGLNILII